MIKMSHAEKWLEMVRNGEIDTAKYDNIDIVPFDDGSEVHWDGQQWFVAFTARTTLDKPIAEGTIRENHGYPTDPKPRMKQPTCDIPLGIKTDKYKPRWSLLPVGTINEVIKALEYGAVKYSVGNWQHVDDAGNRYYDATMRHLEAWFNDEKDDKESGLPHLAHAVCCLLFLMWFDKEKK